MDHGKTTLTAAKSVLSEAGGSSTANFVAYDQIDKAPEEKKEELQFQLHVEYETEKDTMLTLTVGHVDCQKYDYRCCSNGWSNFSS